MKAWPLGLLIVAGVIFVIGWYFEKQPDSSWIWGYVRAAAEAGMVGGLADWFAVTALFRHPMGIPIPHTALIPAKKDQLGASLADFVRVNFLNPQVVRARVAAADPAGRLGTYLQQPATRRRVVAEGATLAATGIRSINDAEAQLIVRNLLFEQAAVYAWGPPAGRLLGAVVADRNHEPAVDALFRVARDWVVEHEQQIVELVAERGPAQGFFLARAAHEAVGRRAYQELHTWLNEAVADPTCGIRQAVDNWLAETAIRLREDPELISRVELFKQRVLASPETHEAVASIWPTTRRILLESLADPEGELRRRAEDWVASTADRLVGDAEFRATVNERIEGAAAYLSERYGQEAVVLISETVARWDATEASERIELQVGRDLQYIRINGTVVGALAGIVIHAVGTLLLG
ncbi:MAG: hypothetical protein QG597_342 [Actinomycetota bacterium]|nr:hypothetical protein [Actinomycetota bacterium]